MRALGGTFPLGFGGTAFETRGGNGLNGGASIVASGGIGLRGGQGVYALGGTGTGPASVGGAAATLIGGNGEEPGPGLVAESGAGLTPSDAIIAIGNVSVTGDVSGQSIGFRIDNPLSAARGKLRHSVVYSPDMKTVYDGIATLDSQGSVTVSLPEWFQALNEDYRYQLTSIGGAAPQLHIAAEIANNAFRIAGGLPGGKVSWLVTGIRRDAFAQQNRIKVEGNQAPAFERWLKRREQ